MFIDRVFIYLNFEVDGENALSRWKNEGAENFQFICMI